MPEQTTPPPILASPGIDTMRNGEVLRTLGYLVRGLSALFWGLPLSLIICVQSARGDWLQPLGILPPVASTGLLLYGLWLCSRFQKQERIWRLALDRAAIFGVVNVGLAPFLYWWNRMPGNTFYTMMMELMVLNGFLFLFNLNPMLYRLTLMLPDEALRHESQFFTTVNRCMLLVSIGLMMVYSAIMQAQEIPAFLHKLVLVLEQGGLWALLFLILLPVAMTMALIWKTKEVILASVFGSEH